MLWRCQPYRIMVSSDNGEGQSCSTLCILCLQFCASEKVDSAIISKLLLGRDSQLDSFHIAFLCRGMKQSAPSFRVPLSLQLESWTVWQLLERFVKICSDEYQPSITGDWILNLFRILICKTFVEVKEVACSMRVPPTIR